MRTNYFIGVISLWVAGGIPLCAATASSTTLASSPNPSVLGRAVALTAIVSPSTATGTVTFYDGVSILGISPLSGGVATLTLTQLPAGPAPLKAFYTGDSATLASSSGPVQQAVTTVLEGGLLPAVNYTGGLFPIAVAVADLNRDGIADLISANLSGNSVSILLGNGDGTFQTASNYNVGVSPRAIAVADFNGDGVPDVAVANENAGGAGSVSVLLGNGDGSLQSAVNYTVGSDPRSLVAGDFNGDGKADLAVANFASGTVSILSGKGDGTFQVPLSTAAGTSPQSLAAADLNGDGKTDLIVANSGISSAGTVNGNGGIGVLLGNGDGTFITAVTYSAGANPVALAVADLNADGKPDLAVANLNGSSISALPGNGDGTFQTAVTTTAGSQPVSLVTGDFNGDGKPDLAVANQSAATITVLTGNGNFTFQPGVATSVGSSPSWLAIGEFNGDGRADLVTANLTGAGLSVLLGRVSVSSVTLTSSANPSAYGQSTTLTATVNPANATGRIAFYDGVSVLSTVAVSGGQATFSTRLLSSGAHSLKAWFSGNSTLPASTSAILRQNVAAIPGGGFSAAVSYATGSSDARRLLAADFNGDGYTDVAVLNRAAGNVSILLGSGNGVLQPAVHYAVGSTPLSFVAGDFNGDGIPDLATANSGAGTVSILLGVGNGTFRAAVNYSAGSALSSIAAADFNGDGYQDLAVTNNAASGAVTVLLGNGDGTFQSPVSWAAGVSPDSLVAGDFNGDGQADLAAGSDAGSLIVLLGNGDAAFAAPLSSTLASPLTAVDAIARDFNGDGHTDLAFANSSGGILVALGNGDGAFQSAASYALPSNPLTLTAGDFNGDGVSDLAVAGNGAYVLFGNADGTFQPASALSAGVSPNAIVAADLNGDGRIDLITAGASSVNVLLAGTPPSSTVTLVAAPNPSASGSSITLTAAVSPSSATGKITFYDSVTILGTRTLTGGQATLSTSALAPGPLSLRAYYAGSSAGLPATSATVTQTVTPLSQAGFQSPRTLNAGTAATGGAQSILQADFNGDGRPDLAVLNSATASIAILIDNGSGAFAAPQDYSTLAAGSAMVTGDFNGDGIADLAVTVASTGTVNVLLGNGDGSFQAADAWGAFTSPGALAVADLNGDGKPDLAVATATGLDALIGNGDGTFGAAVLCSSCTAAQAVAVADLNGDGKADLIVTASDGISLDVLPGNGNATFQTPVAYRAHTAPDFIAIADFNGDGKTDIAASNASSGDISILLGNGDGTLQTAVNYTALTSPEALAAGDFNGDGKPDLAVIGASSDVLLVLTGNGNGTFAAPMSYTLPASPVSLAVGDINGDGRTDVALFAGSAGVMVLWGRIPPGVTPATAVLTSSQNPSTASQSIVLTAAVSPSAATGRITFYDGATVLGTAPLTSGLASFATPLLPSGSQALRAIYSGDATYTAATATLTQTVAPVSSSGFRTANPLALSSGANVLASGDFNGDGKPDLVVAGASAFAVILNSGSGAFAAPVSYAFPNAGPVAVADFNGDGYPDLAIASSYGATGAIFLGNGHGGFQQSTTVIGDALALVAADFNNDGNVDLALVGNSNIAILLGNGDGTFALPVTWAAGNGPVAAVAADFNGDGNIDLAVADSGGNSDGTNVTLLAGNGDGTFRAATTVSAGTLFSSVARSVAVGDFNLDGKPDLAVATWNTANSTGTVSVLSGNGNGTFQAAVNNAVSVVTGSLTALDFNGDGKPDLAAAAVSGTSVFLFPGNGNGSFQSAVSYAVGHDPASLAAADFNGDGRVDLAAANSGDKTVSLLFATGASSVALASSANPSSYSQAVTLTAAVTPSTATGKVTFYDGAVVLGTRSLSSGQAQLPAALLGVGNRILRAIYSGDANYSVGTSPPMIQTVGPLPQNGVTLLGAFAAGAAPRSVAAGDFNGDGRLDLAVAANGDNTLRILLGNGDGTLRAGVGYAVASGPAAVAAADFNGDGLLDVALASATSGTVSIFPGNGDGTIRAGSGATASGSPVSLQVGDFNGDSKPDLVAANASGSLDVFLGNGDGTFQARATYAAGAGLAHVAVADLNGDAFPDLIAANSTAGTVSVLLGKGDGTFAAAVNYSVGVSPVFVAIGDFNGDGKTDLAVAIAGKVALLKGNGDGTFQAAVSYAAGNGPASIVVGDFNGDSRPDLAVANRLDNTVGILYGNGDGTFQTMSAAPSGNGPVAMAGADFNNDGLVDLAIANTGDNAVATMLGIPPGPSLAISLSHANAFSLGESGFTYTIVVANAGNAPTSGNVTVADTLPAGLTATAIAGVGWTCDPVALTCTRSDSLAVAASYPSITLTVSVAISASASVTNTATAQGGGDLGPVSHIATDPTVITDVGQTPQTISFLSPPPQSGPASFAVAATSSSGLTVTLASNTLQVCVISGTAVTPVAPGTCSLTATQAGNSTYAAAAPVTRTFAIASAGISLSLALASAANPSAFGRALTLTATVTPAAATGSVTFYDDAAILGTAPLSGGSATFTTVLIGSGLRSLRAVYGGNLSYAIAKSAALEQTVTASAATGFASPVSYATGLGASSAAIADFNLDGKPDIAVANLTAGAVSLLAGRGDGTFAVAVNTSVTLPALVAAGDFNGDGFPDIAVVSNNSVAATSSLTILAGNGSGAFLAGTAVAVNPLAAGLAVADFNGDGIADLVISSGASEGALGVLLGKGDGTFTAAPVASLAAGISAGSLAVGDFNGDGIPDVAVVTGASGSVQILLSRGDGSFAAPVGYSAGPFAASVATGDFNGDGLPDLAVAVDATGSNGSVAVLRGNGDGTFQSAVSWTAGHGPHAVYAADINGDGKPDLAVVDNVDDNLGVFFGNGDGTFQAGTAYSAGASPQSLVLGDFNGDSRIDAGVLDSSLNGIVALLGQSSGPDLVISKTHAGVFNPGQTGAVYTLTVSNSGLGSSVGLVSVNDLLPSGLTATGMTGTGWNCILSSLTCTRADALAGGSSWPSIAVTVNVSPTAPASVTNGASVSGGGDTVLTDNTATDTTIISPQTPQTVAFANPGDQLVGAPPLTLAVSASSGNTVTVTSTTASVCTVAGDVLTTVAAGTCSLTASQPGNSTYAAAVPVSVSFTVRVPSDFTVYLTDSGNFSQGETGATYTITVANVGSGAAPGTVTVTDSLPSGFTATAMAGAGWTCVLASLTCTRSDVLPAASAYSPVTLTANISSAAASTVTDTATVSSPAELDTDNDSVQDQSAVSPSGKRTQTITFAALSNQTLGSPAVALAATASSGLAVTFTSQTSLTCTVSGSLVTLVAAGTCSIAASQAGNATYNAAVPVVQSFTITAASSGGGGGGGGAAGGGTPTASPLSVYPTSLTFSVNGAAPVPQTVNLYSSAATTYTVALTTAAGGNWLSVSPLGGDIPSDRSLTVTVTPAGLTTGTYLGTIAVTSPQATVTIPVTVDVIASQAGALTATPASLAFTYVQGAAAVPALQTLLIGSSVVPASYIATATAANNGTWLTVTSSSGAVPGLVPVAVNVTGLAPGTYTATVAIVSQGVGAVSVPVTLTISKGTSSGATLLVSPLSQSFTLSPADNAAAGQIAVSNTGTGALQFTAQASVNQGSWLTLSAAGGSAAAGAAPVLLGFSVDPSGLSVGVYTGTVTIAQSGTANTAVVNVVLTVSSAQASLEVSQTGLIFAAQSGGPAPPPAAVTVANGGPGNLAWTARTQVLGGVADWLSVSPASGTSTGAGSPLTVSVNQSGLSPGQYYGSIDIAAPAAGNSPQVITVVLTVAASGANGGVELSSGGVLLSGLTGSVAPGSEQVSLFNPSSSALRYTTVVTPAGGWLSVSPASGSLSPGANPLSVSAGFSGLAAGVQTGSIAFNFADGSGAVVQVVAIAPGSAGSQAAISNVVAAGCSGGSPGSLVAVFDQPSGGQSVHVGIPQLVQAELFDDCGNPVTASSGGAAQVAFDSGDPGITLSDAGSGIWQGTWTPSNPRPLVHLQLAAAELALALNPAIDPVVAVAVQPAGAGSPPIPGGIVNAAAGAQATLQVVTPGSYIAIYGSELAASGAASASAAPLPDTLNGTQLFLGGVPMPLSWVGTGQVNALVPQNLNANTTYQLLVVSGATQSVPVPLTVAPLQPGIFTLDASGSGQGIAEIAGTTLLAAPKGSGTAPALRGTDYLEVFCTGLGPVTGPNGQAGPADGVAAPASTLYQTTAAVTATLGGVPAPVTFAGLTPTLVALYQVNVQVPASAPAGDAVPLVITVTDPATGNAAESNTVTVALQ